MTVRELYKRLRDSGEVLYGAGESSQIARMIMEEMWGIDKMALLLRLDDDSGVEEGVVKRVEGEIVAARPVQYIIGEAEFSDFRLTVREGVLIPRPESEELIRWIIEREGDVKRMMDIGCGSGVLAIALARAFTASEVVAMDISDAALAIARENGERLAEGRIGFVKGSALESCDGWGVEVESLDVIVSNPPYIPQSEIDAMRANVTEYEPHIALFVPDADPLLFYRAIAEAGLRLLRRGGRIYYEIHELFGAEMVELLESMGYEDVELRLDINDKARMICATRS